MLLANSCPVGQLSTVNTFDWEMPELASISFRNKGIQAEGS